MTECQIEMFVSVRNAVAHVSDYQGNASGHGHAALDLAIADTETFLAQLRAVKAETRADYDTPAPSLPAPSVCDTCGKTLGAGEWPFCGGINNHGYGSLRMIRDGIPGGLTIHNLGPTPVTVYSHAERKAIMRARGLREHVEHVDGDRHVGRMV